MAAQPVSQYDGYLPLCRDNPGWNLTTAMADDAIGHINTLNAIAPDKPFFVYYAPEARMRPTIRRPSGLRSSKASSTWDGTPCANRYSKIRKSSG